MNKRNRCAKKCFALFLSFIMVVCMMPQFAFAAGTETETAPATDSAPATVSVNFTSQANNAFLHGPQFDTEVSADLAESYGYKDTVSPAVSALDVLVKAHQVKYGDEFTSENAASKLVVAEDGTVTKFFGIETENKFDFVMNARPSADVVGKIEVSTGDTLEFFIYQDDDKSDHYIIFSNDHNTSRFSSLDSRLKKTSAVTGVERVIYPFGYKVYETKGFSDKAILDQTQNMEGLQLGVVKADGSITPIEGAVSNVLSYLAFALQETENCYITVYTPEENIKQGETPVILPILKTDLVEPPQFTSLEIYENQQAYNNNAEPIPYTPALEKDKFTGYSIVLPDNAKPVFIAAKFSEDGSIFNGSKFEYKGQKYSMLTRKPDGTPYASGYSQAGWKNGYIDICFMGEPGSSLNNYLIKVLQYTTLEALEVEGIMAETFNPLNKEYHASVDSSKDGVAIKATPYKDDYTVTINGTEITNGESYTLPYKWNDDGEMDVAIVVKGKDKQDTTYTLTLNKMPREDTPLIATQPKGAEYTVLDKDIKEMRVLATANGAMTYQWYKASAEDKQDAVPIANATEPAYTPKNDTPETAYYFCRVTNTDKNKTADSDVASVIVHADPTPVVSLTSEIPALTEKVTKGYTHPDTHGYIYKVGASATPLTISCTVPEEGGTISTQWYYKENQTSAISFISSDSTLTPGTAPKDAKNEGGWYYCVVKHQFLGKTYTTTSPMVYCYVSTTEAMKPEISTQPVSAKYMLGDRIIRLLAIAKSGTYASASYQWYINDTDSTTGGREIEGATSFLYIPPSPATEVGTNYYYCKVTNTQQGHTESVFSNIAAITVEKMNVNVPLQGEGTKTSPYIIETKEDLQAVADLVKSGYSFAGEYLKLTKDIELFAKWNGIGAKQGSEANGVSLRPFSGTLDGGREDGEPHTITFAKGSKALLKYAREATVKNLQIKAPYMNDYALLSNYVVDYGKDGNYNTGVPETIRVENVTLQSGSVIKKGGFLGGGASGGNVCRFINCKVEKDVKIGFNKETNASSGLDSVGSFAGSVNGSFTGCVSYADVYGVSKVGGIFGAKSQSMGPCSAANCSFFGNIHATGDFVGGIAGAGYASESAPNSPCVGIQNCTAAGTISGRNNVGGIFGGEELVCQNWGAAYIRNNSFCGTLTASGADANVGGIVGYMNSLNKSNIFENNYYCAEGVSKPVGEVKYVDTDCVSHEKDSGAEYFNTSVKLPDIPGMAHKNMNRSDDPLGKDKDTLGKAMTAAQMADGTVANLLNQSDSSYKNWTTESGVPVHSSKPVVYELQLSGYKTDYQVGDSFSTTGMTVIGKLTDASTTEIPLSECKFEGFDSSKAGNPEITVSYGAAKATYTVNVRYAKPENVPVTIQILGDTKHGEPTAETGTHTLSGGGLTTWVSASYTDFNQNHTVWDVIQKALADNNMTCSNPTGNYIASITKDGVTLGEFTNGKLSGWMYTLNGTHPELGVSEQFIKKGDVIVLHYTDDYTKEEGSEKWNTPVETTQSATQDTTATVNKDGEATSKLTSSDVDKLVDAAVKNAATTVEVNVKGADKADKVSVELPKTSVSNIANKTDAALQVTTPAGTVTMDKQAMKEAVKAASGSDLTIVLDKQDIADASKEPLGSTAAQTKVSILSGGKEIKDLGTAKVKILLPVSDAMKDKTMAAATVDKDGKLTKTEGKLVTVNGKTYYQIETSKPGAFVVAESANLDAAIKAQAGETDDEKLAKIKKGVKNTTIRITRTSKGKGWIKIKWKKSKGYKVDYYEVFRKTGKNSKFSKKAFYKAKKHGITGSYKNTKALKKGKRYYYKVRGVRVIDGKKYYTKWSKTYYRIAK